MQTWKTKLLMELSRAESARSKGNEGQARVCARRAAAIAVREHLSRKGKPEKSSSAMDVLAKLDQDPALSPDLRAILSHLRLRVNEGFELPPGIDLIQDTRRLCNALFPGWEMD